MEGMELIRSQRGLMASIARGLGITRAAVATWKRVPAERVAEVSRLTGLPMGALRPDMFGPPAVPGEREAA
jgi:pyruvate kinase